MSLLKHCADGNLTGIKAVLSNVRCPKQELRERDNHNWTCLHHAVKSQSVECIEYLLTIKELDTTAQTYGDETALHLACGIPNVSIEIVSMLLEANKDLVNFVNVSGQNSLQCAILHKRLDIVQLLIHHGASVNHEAFNGDTPLHTAARKSQVEIIRYLLYESDCDPTIRGRKELSACVELFQVLILKNKNLPLLQEEIDCFEELVLFIYDERDFDDYKIELYEMVNVWHRLSLPVNRLYIVMVNMFKVTQQRQYFVQKIFQLNIPYCSCLIFNLIEEPNYYFSVTYHSNFVCELLSLFLLDESFFKECLSEIMSNGSLFQSAIQIGLTEIKKETVQPQQMLNLLKYLILYEIDIDFVMEIYGSDFLNVFAPLVKFVMPPIETIRCTKFAWLGYISDNSFLYYFTGTPRPDPRPELIHDGVVSLKDISRTSVRAYYFHNYSHYNALKALHTLNIPIQIRNFLCYNFCNLKF